MRKHLQRLAVVGGLVGSGVANAAIDTSTIVTDVGANQGELMLLGLAILTCVYSLRAFSWGRKI